MKRTISRMQFLRLSIFTLFVLFFLFYTILRLNASSADILLLITFVINIIYSMFRYISSVRRHPYSLESMFWLFNFIFLSVAPLVQYVVNWAAWGLITDDDERLLCNLMVFLWYLCFDLGRQFRRKRITKEASRCSIRMSRLRMLILLSIVIILFLLYTTGIGRLLFRASSALNEVSMSSWMSLLTYHGFRNLFLYDLTFVILARRQKRTVAPFDYLTIPVFLLGCFPTGLSRYMIAAFYGGTLIHLIGKKRCSTWFALLVFFGMIIVFPALNVFRYSNEFMSLPVLVSQLRNALSNHFLTGNYDAYQMIISGFHYVRYYGIVHGRQLLGALLFFVPRSIWRNKPIGSGAMVINSLHQYSFSNVSMPLPGELFLNFGVAGVVIVGLMIGHLTRYIDDLYWKGDDIPDTLNIVYPFLVFYFFFVQRGDLLSAGAYLIANQAVGIACCLFCLRKQPALEVANELENQSDR